MRRSDCGKLVAGAFTDGNSELTKVNTLATGRNGASEHFADRAIVSGIRRESLAVTDLVRLVLFNTSAGGILGCASALAISLFSAGSLAELLDDRDRLIGLVMLMFTLGPSFAVGCLGTALAGLADH